MNIIYMGTPEFAVYPLKKLLETEHRVICVVSQPDSKRDRGKKVKYTPVKEVAIENEIDILQPDKIKDNIEFLNELKSYEPDLIVVAAYGKILPEEILNMPKYGCINIHGSLLPRWRGAAPIQRAIMNQDEKSGATLMYMAKGLDTGDMIAKVEVDIASSRKNSLELFEDISIAGGNLLVDNLDKIFSGNVTRTLQNEDEVTYANIITKEEGLIDFNRTAKEIDCQIRGLFMWPGAYTNLKDKVIKVWEAIPCRENINEKSGKILNVDERGIEVACKDSTILFQTIQLPNKKRVKVSEYIKGNTIEVGSFFG